MQPPAQKEQQVPGAASTAAAAALGLPSTAAATPGLQTVPEQSGLQPEKSGQPSKEAEDVFAWSTAEGLMLGGHEGDGSAKSHADKESARHRSSSLTEAVRAADSAGAGHPVMPPAVSHTVILLRWYNVILLSAGAGNVWIRCWNDQRTGMLTTFCPAPAL